MSDSPTMRLPTVSPARLHNVSVRTANRLLRLPAGRHTTRIPMEANVRIRPVATSVRP